MAVITGEKRDTKVEQFREICEKMARLYERKNADYGDSFHKTFELEGLAMSRIRLMDKLNRFCSITRKGSSEVNDESAIDTLIDLANYAVMTIMEMEG